MWGMIGRLFGFGPESGRFVGTEELHVDDVGMAANRAILGVSLSAPAVGSRGMTMDSPQVGQT